MQRRRFRWERRVDSTRSGHKLAALADRVTWGGGPEHEINPETFGLDHPSGTGPTSRCAIQMGCSILGTAHADRATTDQKRTVAEEFLDHLNDGSNGQKRPAKRWTSTRGGWRDLGPL